VFDLADVRIESRNAYAVILAVALEGDSLRAAPRVLIQATTVARPHGFRAEPAAFKGSDGKTEYRGFRIASLGGPPWNVVKTDATVTIRNPSLREAVALDSNGTAVGTMKSSRRADRFTVVLPPDALYLICR
jgi:hypothetical protein